MTFTRAVSFYKKYEGLMTDEEILAETGFSAERIRVQIAKTKGQLCWTCANACNDISCEWVRNCYGRQGLVRVLDYPEYVKTKKIPTRLKGQDVEIPYIVSCEKWQWDGRSK